MTEEGSVALRRPVMSLSTYFLLHDNLNWQVGPVSLTDDQIISCRCVLSHGNFHPVCGNVKERDFYPVDWMFLWRYM